MASLRLPRGLRLCSTSSDCFATTSASAVLRAIPSSSRSTGESRILALPDLPCRARHRGGLEDDATATPRHTTEPHRLTRILACRPSGSASPRSSGAVQLGQGLLGPHVTCGLVGGTPVQKQRSNPAAVAADPHVGLVAAAVLRIRGNSPDSI